MSSCLGIYIGDKVVKYAKLVTDDKSNSIKAVAYGTRVHPGNKSDAISNIIAATGSDDIGICVNSENERIHKVEVLRRIGKSDLESLIDLEVVDFTGNNEDKNERNFTYKYTLLDSTISKDNYTANIAIQEKAYLDKYLSNEDNKVVSIYPMPYILDEVVSKETANYLIINMNENTELSFVNAGKLINVTKMELGMKKIFEAFPEMLGSFQKAYDVCKTINVFSDDSNNSPELEAVIEPVLQDALNRIQAKIQELNLRVDKIYLTGAITLFINSDILFEQYFDIPTEKLRPYFIDSSDSSYNMAEVTESAEAFALAYEGLMAERPELDFLRQQSKFGFSFNRPDKKKNNGAKELSTKKKKVKSNNNNFNNLYIGGISLEKIKPILIFANVVVATLLVMYAAFAGIYNYQLNNQISAIKEEQARVSTSTSTMNQDIAYINSNRVKYDNYTNYIEETLRKIKNGEIGQNSTYNVALFMLKVSKYIPENVLIRSIESDSNRHVTIVAYSKSHVELGYLVSQLKLQGILEPSSVQTTAVVHDSVITVTIGGDLP